MTINCEKTFCVVLTKGRVKLQCKLKIKGQAVKQEEQFIYMGCLLTSNGRNEKEIESGIGMTKIVFNTLRYMYTDQQAN